MGRRKPRWLDRWFQPWGKHGETGFLRRAKLALSPYNHVYTLPLFSPALLFVCTGLLVEVFVNGVQGQFLLGILVGYLGSAAIAYPLGLHRTLTNFRKELAIFAAQKIARRLPPSVTNDLRSQ